MKDMDSNSSKKLNERNKSEKDVEAVKAVQISSFTDKNNFFANHFEKAKAMWKKQQPFPMELLKLN